MKTEPTEPATDADNDVGVDTDDGKGNDDADNVNSGDVDADNVNSGDADAELDPDAEADVDVEEAEMNM